MLPPLASVRVSERAMLYSVIVPVFHRVEPKAQAVGLLVGGEAGSYEVRYLSIAGLAT